MINQLNIQCTDKEALAMFSFFKQKSEQLYAPIDGKVISLDDVDDPIFSKRKMGEGVAIIASGHMVYAPADGEIAVTIERKHAFGMILDNEMELIVHVGINLHDTQCSDFEILVKEHEHVKKGTPIIKINPAALEHGLITPVIITNSHCFSILNNHIGEDVKAKESILIEYR